MRRSKGFRTFSRFQKCAEFGLQCGDDPPGGNFHVELSSNGSCRSRRAHQLVNAGGLWAGGVLAAVGLPHWRSFRTSCRFPGRCEKYWNRVVLVLPVISVVSILPGPALRDGFSHVLGLRIVVPEALRRLSGQLLRQRQSGPLQTLRLPCGQLLRQRQSALVPTLRRPSGQLLRQRQPDSTPKLRRP